MELSSHIPLSVDLSYFLNVCFFLLCTYILSLFDDFISSGLPKWLSGKESTYQCRRHKRCRFYPWVRKISGGGNSNPLQYSCQDNPMDRRAWWTIVHGFAELDMTEHLSMHAYFLYPNFCFLRIRFALRLIEASFSSCGCHC